MSIKTSKRIALGVIASLVFAPFAAIAPASAAIAAATFSVAESSVTVVVGQQRSIAVNFGTTTSANQADTDRIIVTPSVANGVPISLNAADPSTSTLGADWEVTATGGTPAIALTATPETGETPAKAQIEGQTIGNIRFTADQVGLFQVTVTLSGTGLANTGDPTQLVKTITVNAIPGVNSATLSFITRGTTLADVSNTARTLTTIATTPASYPGYSSVVNAGLGSGGVDAVTSITVPTSKAIVFDINPKSGTTYSAGTQARLVLNGTLYAQVAMTNTTTGVLGSIPSPSTAGTYTASLVISGSQGSFDPAFTESIPFTLVVGNATTSLAQFGVSTATSGPAVVTVSATKLQVSGRVGTPISFTPTYVVKSVTGNNALADFAARIRYSLTLPAGTAGTLVDAETAGVATTNQLIAGRSFTLNAGLTDTQNSNALASSVFFTPATAGTYTVTLFHDANNNALVDVGEISGTVTWVVEADGQPSITFTKYGNNLSAGQADANALGQLVKISLRNGTTPWSLAANETLTLTSGVSTTKILRHTNFNSAGTVSWTAVDVTELVMNRSHFNGNGDAWINVGNTNTLGGTFAVSAVISGGTAAGASGSFTITTFAADDATVSTDFLRTAPGLAALSNANKGKGVADDGTYSGATETLRIKPGVTTSVAIEVAVAANNLQYFAAKVTDTLGLWTGVEGAIYSITARGPSTGALATSVTSLSVSVPGSETALLATNTNIGSIEVLGANNTTVVQTVTIAVQTAAAATVAVNPVNQTGVALSVRAAKGSTNTFKAWVLDQFGNPMQAQTVSAQVTAGRNIQAIGTPLFTSASGMVEFTVTDTHTGTFLLTDTVTFAVTGATSGVVTVNYAAYNPVSKIVITGGASADIAPAVTRSFINTSISGASATRVTMTATLTDANGGTLPAGIPVKWSISGLTGTSAIYVDPISGYDYSTTMTDVNGQATTQVYAWAVGTVEVTATADDITSATAGKINFANSGLRPDAADRSADARVVTATVAGNVVTVKVVDRYGNAVAGVSITATRTAGTGYFGGNSASSAVAETGENGTVDFIVVGGGATVSVRTTSTNVGQTGSAAGEVNGVAITATSIGASLSPAGVQSATATVDAPPVVVPPVVYDKPTLSFVKSGGRVFLSGTAVEGEGDIIIYTKRIGTTAWKERAKTLEVAAPGDFNGSIKALKNNVVIRVKQEGTGLFSNQVIVLK
jgi:hypothetical protein